MHMSTYQRQKQTSLTSGLAWSSSTFLQDPVDSASTDQSLAEAFSILEARRLPVVHHLHPTHNSDNISVAYNICNVLNLTSN